MKRRSYAALALTAAIGLSGCASDTDRNDPSADPAISTPSSDGTPTPDDAAVPPWPAPSDVAARVAAAGLDLAPMGTAERYHPRLRVIIDGAEVPVPPDIGVDPTTGAMSALHTHEGDGTIHIEADSVGEVFTLSQFFTQWAWRLPRNRSAASGRRLGNGSWSRATAAPRSWETRLTSASSPTRRSF